MRVSTIIKKSYKFDLFLIAFLLIFNFESRAEGKKIVVIRGSRYEYDPRDKSYRPLSDNEPIQIQTTEKATVLKPVSPKPITPASNFINTTLSSPTNNPSANKGSPSFRGANSDEAIIKSLKSKQTVSTDVNNFFSDAWLAQSNSSTKSIELKPSQDLNYAFHRQFQFKENGLLVVYLHDLAGVGGKGAVWKPHTIEYLILPAKPSTLKVSEKDSQLQVEAQGNIWTTETYKPDVPFQIKSNQCVTKYTNSKDPKEFRSGNNFKIERCNHKIVIEYGYGDKSIYRRPFSKDKTFKIIFPMTNSFDSQKGKSCNLSAEKLLAGAGSSLTQKNEEEIFNSLKSDPECGPLYNEYLIQEGRVKAPATMNPTKGPSPDKKKIGVNTQVESPNEDTQTGR